MYLFSRRVRLAGGKPKDAMAWATRLTQRVNEVSGLQVSLWSQTLSPAVGTVVWSAFAPDLPTLQGGLDKLMDDEAYYELVGHGPEFTIPGSLDDTLAVIVHGPQPDPDRKPQYVASVRTTIVAGGLAKGMALGVEIAERAKQITGIPTAFLAAATGNYGGVSWLTAFADAAELERAQMALNTDGSFVELIDSKAPGVYTDHPGATTQLLYRRVT